MSRNYLFVSDLHLSEGRDPVTGQLSRNEDFFHDDAFARFLVYHVELSGRENAAEAFRRPWSLVINGDIFDFLQVTRLPAEGDELLAVSGVASHAELRPNEREYGLGTRSSEIVWKLAHVARGHPMFFQALGWFLAHEGNRLVLINGNHDVELYWPAVQDEMRRLIAAAYLEWRELARAGELVDAGLPWRETLPAAINDIVANTIQFPAWFYYEPGLFFAEHGNQYDPANAFSNFLAPILHDRPDLIELPSGSFFVRYFFNKVEQVHPFADNIKPISRYLRWAVNEEPLDTLRMLVAQRRMMWRSLGNLLQKRANPIKGGPDLRKHAGMPGSRDQVPLGPERWAQLIDIRDRFQDQAEAGASRTSQYTAGAVGLYGGLWLALVAAMRAFVREQWGRLLAGLAVAGGAFVGRTLLGQRLDNVQDLTSLADVASAIAAAFTEPDGQGHVAAVPFYIFGHDHHARVRAIAPIGTGAPPAWYVNTGAWLPTFSERDRLARRDVQLTFLRLVPEANADGQAQSELLEWLPDADRPRPIRLLD